MRLELQKLTIPMASTVREALRAIDAGGQEICLVVDDSRRLVGLLSDGDIRRAILRGLGLDDPVDSAVNHEFISVGPGVGRAEVLDLMEATAVGQVPVVDPEMHILGLHVLRELIGTPTRPNTAVIMAGGRGVRLRPLTETLPKPMIRVAGRPILERLVLHLGSFGVRRVVLAVNYMADVIVDHFGDGSQLGCEITYVHEQPDNPLGTAGALTLLPAEVVDAAHPILVMNGDLVTTAQIDEMLDYHLASRAVATVGVELYSHAIPFGVLEMDADSISGITEKPVETWPVNAGIYVLAPQLIGAIPRGVVIGMTDVLLGAVERRERIAPFRIGGDWIDIGMPSELARARGEEL